LYQQINGINELMTVPAPEPIGRRIARLRQQLGWTQQALAARLAISRVAVSHIEMDLSLPSERTITLLAGIFKLSPRELVAGTTYPPAKADRLPSVASSYTPAELQVALLEHDLDWLEKVGKQLPPAEIAALRQGWQQRLQALLEQTTDEYEGTLLRQALERLRGG